MLFIVTNRYNDPNLQSWVITRSKNERNVDSWYLNKEAKWVRYPRSWRGEDPNTILFNSFRFAVSVLKKRFPNVKEHRKEETPVHCTYRANRFKRIYNDH